MAFTTNYKANKNKSYLRYINNKVIANNTNSTEQQEKSNQIIDLLLKINKHLAHIDYDVSQIKREVGVKEKLNKKIIGD